MSDYLFSVTLYRDGQIRIDGHGRHENMADILRMIALSIESGATILNEYGDNEDDSFDWLPPKEP